MDLKDLVKEIDYQKEYSYENRVDLMNKYAISTSQKYFNLIYELGKFIVGDRRISELSSNEDNIFYGSHNSCYSHTGAVMSQFNNQSHSVKNHQATVRILNNSIILYTRVYESKESKLRPFLSFDLDSKTFTVRASANQVIIRRGIYEEIDEWLVDFGFEKVVNKISNMNIIEAIQKAENGCLITNNFLNVNNRFYKYKGGGVFGVYQLIDEKPEYKYETHNFSMAEILSLGWEILEKDYFTDLIKKDGSKLHTPVYSIFGFKLK